MSTPRSRIWTSWCARSRRWRPEPGGPRLIDALPGPGTARSDLESDGFSAMALRRGAGTCRAPHAAMDLFARAGRDLFLGVLFSSLPDQGADRPPRRPARGAVPGRGGRVARSCPVLVCAVPVLALLERPRAHGSDMDRPDRIPGRLPEPLAPPELLGLLGVLPRLRLLLERVL